MKKPGIIGGLGPMATVYLMQLIVEMTDAKEDQDHIEILLHSKPAIPDRTQFLVGKSTENPIKEIVEVGIGLKNNGADFIAIPCITAHSFWDVLHEKIGCPMINAVDETVEYLKKKDYKKVGIMATDGTVKCSIFQDSLTKYGMEYVLPEAESQELVMDLIYKDIKAGKKVNFDYFLAISDELKKQGAEVIILGCTELSLIKRDYDLPAGYIDVLDILAWKIVSLCAKCKEEYNELITQ